jgi:hypothetical protein
LVLLRTVWTPKAVFLFPPNGAKTWRLRYRDPRQLGRADTRCLFGMSEKGGMNSPPAFQTFPKPT